MFTKATREFGVWKQTHTQRKFQGVSYASPLIVALGMCAFVCWLIFFVALKVRAEFYVLENNGINLPKIDEHSAVAHPRREVALRFGVKEKSNNQILVLLESGDEVLFPQQKSKLDAIIEKRVQDMEFTGMLTLVASPAISRVEIWPEEGLPNIKFNALLEYLTKSGFDQFDIAMETE